MHVNWESGNSIPERKLRGVFVKKIHHEPEQEIVEGSVGKVQSDHERLDYRVGL